MASVIFNYTKNFLFVDREKKTLKKKMDNINLNWDEIKGTLKGICIVYFPFLYLLSELYIF